MPAYGMQVRLEATDLAKMSRRVTKKTDFGPRIREAIESRIEDHIAELEATTPFSHDPPTEPHRHTRLSWYWERTGDFTFRLGNDQWWTSYMVHPETNNPSTPDGLIHPIGEHPLHFWDDGQEYFRWSVHPMAEPAYELQEAWERVVADAAGFGRAVAAALLRGMEGR